MLKTTIVGLIALSLLCVVASFSTHAQHPTIPPPPTSTPHNVFIPPLMRHESYPVLWTGTVMGTRATECLGTYKDKHACTYLRMIRQMEFSNHYWDWYVPVGFDVYRDVEDGLLPIGSWCSILKVMTECCRDYWDPSTYWKLCACDELARQEHSQYVILACVPEKPPNEVID